MSVETGQMLCPDCARLEYGAPTGTGELTIRVAVVPDGKSVPDNILHPICAMYKAPEAGYSPTDIEYRELTITQMLEQGITSCDYCGEHMTPPGFFLAGE